MSLLVSLIAVGDSGILPPNSVSNGELAKVPANTMKGNDTGLSADVKDLTVEEINTLLNTAVAILNTKGDLLTHNATTEVRLPIGAPGQLMTPDPSVSLGVKWDSLLPNAVEDLLIITNDGDTGFFMSAQPSAPDAFAAYLNGQLRLRGVDYTQSGFVFTWLDPGGLTLKTTDIVVLRFNDTALSIPSTKEVFISATDYGADNGDYRVRNISMNGDFNFTFFVPFDFSSVNSATLIGIPSAGAAGAGKDIDLSSEYATFGQASNANSEADTGTTYDLTGTSGEITEVVDLLVVLSSLAASDVVGINVDHNGIGGAIDYLGVKLNYNV